jgi:hypothetical protein
MKILFLDHQGVMRLDPVCWVTGKPELQDFDKAAVKNINDIISETDCEIVVSSDWKLWVPLEEMKDFYISQGIIKSPIGYTPDKSNEIKSPDDLTRLRMEEIEQWLNNNKDVSTWVAVDDLDLRKLERFVFIEDAKIGMTKDSLFVIKNYLNNLIDFI